MLISIERIREPKNLFRLVRKDSVEYHELLDSVKIDGILQPILVRPIGDCYEVIEGNWRFHAARDAGLLEMPCLVRNMSDSEVELVQLKAQAIRPITSKVEFAARLKKLMDRDDLTLGQLGKLVNKGTKWVSSMMSINGLEAPIKKMIDRGEITLRNANALSRLPKRIQSNFTEHAVSLKAPEFEEMVRRAVKDVRQCSQQATTAWLEYRDSHYVAYLRQLEEIKAEASSCRSSTRILDKLGATTPADGWKACLAWLLHIDPDSLGSQKSEKEVFCRRRLELEGRKKRNVELLRDLRDLTPEIHYEQ